jgi:hypothetical protein
MSAMLLLVLVIQFTLIAPNHQPGVTSGLSSESSVVGALRIHPFTSRVFGNTRMLRVLLPPGYDDETNQIRRYPVLYLNDGQNLFDVNTSILSSLEWQVDETVAGLLGEDTIEPLIVVGIDNAGKRLRPRDIPTFSLRKSCPSLMPPIEPSWGRKAPDWAALPTGPPLRFTQSLPGLGSLAGYSWRAPPSTFPPTNL